MTNTVEIKTSELIDQALDWAVAKADGARECEFFDEHTHVWLSQRRYSTDWAQAGPIIEREGLELCKVANDWRSVVEHEGGPLRRYGPTPIIAAMRCFVSSMLGETVDVPAELVPDHLKQRSDAPRG